MISPLTLLRSVPLFAIPSVAMAIVLYWSIPAADRAGVPLLWNVLLQSGILLAALGVFAIVAVTTQRWPGISVRSRLRLAPCRLTDLAIGLLWACFHVFFAWDVVTLIPMGLLIALSTQWRGSTWVAIIAHGVLNLLPWFNLIPAVMNR